MSLDIQNFELSVKHRLFLLSELFVYWIVFAFLSIKNGKEI